MSVSVAVLLISPILLLTLVVGFVVIVALCRAETKGVPTVLHDIVSVFSRVADRVPATAPHSTSVPAEDAPEEDHQDQRGPHSDSATASFRSRPGD
ncbi:hypothetical protein GCM10023203_57280 [Actinomycetospora straminea]|uniref:Secreted protein n=1 Tax=Actinomycetospora straminea TaxID=663607 RepID=A0ABP9F894_9PSEU